MIEQAVIAAVEDQQLAEQGRSEGIRNAGGLESAPDWPRNLANSGKPDAADLAAWFG